MAGAAFREQFAGLLTPAGVPMSAWRPSARVEGTRMQEVAKPCHAPFGRISAQFAGRNEGARILVGAVPGESPQG